MFGNRNYIFLAAILTAVVSARASANALTDKQAEMRSAAQLSTTLQGQIALEKSQTVEAKTVDQTIQAFSAYHRAFIFDFNEALAIYRGMAAELVNDRALDQAELDQAALEFSSAYKKSLDHSTSAKDATSLARTIQNHFANLAVCAPAARGDLKIRQMAAFVSTSMRDASRFYRYQVSNFNPPMYLSQIKDLAVSAANTFDSYAAITTQNVNALPRAGGPASICKKPAILFTLAGAKSIIAEMAADDARLKSLDVAGIIAEVAKAEQAAANVTAVRRFLLGLDTTFQARVAAGNISSAYQIYQSGQTSIQLAIHQVNTNPIFTQTDRDALLKSAGDTWSDIQSTAQASLGSLPALKSALLTRASNLYSKVNADNLTYPFAKSSGWADFKNRFQSALKINLQQPFALPDLNAESDILAFDQQLSTFANELQQFEAMP